MGQPFPWGERTCVMGILNVTPDSFSGDGLAGDVDAAIAQAKAMAAAGADVIDVGGESTAYWKAGYQPVDADEELRRVLPVLERLRSELPHTPLSIDTRKPEVAREALAGGATWLNDVEGVWDDGTMAALAAEHEAVFVIMHNARPPAGRTAASGGPAPLGSEPQGTTGVETQLSEQQASGDPVADIRESLRRAAEAARRLGVTPERIVLDPGLGFGRSVGNEAAVFQRLGELTELGYPVLVGPSRKRFLGRILDAPEQERIEGTAAAVVIAIAAGAAAVRVHDVQPIARAVRVADALVRAKTHG